MQAGPRIVTVSLQATTMSGISNAFTNLIARTPLSAAFGANVQLPEAEDKSLIAETKEHGEIEKCDLRIEGMTCGACVEVCDVLMISLTKC